MRLITIITTFYFVRHAQSNLENHDDATRELSEKGLIDRSLVTRFLKEARAGVVLSSPYKRAVDTVFEYADARGLPVECVDGFRERRIGGEWIEDYEAYARRQWEDFDYKLPDGESLNEVMDRNLRALMDALKKFPGKSIAVGSHGTALSTLIHHFDPSFGFEDFLMIKGLMPWIVKFTFDCESIREIEKMDVTLRPR